MITSPVRTSIRGGLSSARSCWDLFTLKDAERRAAAGPPHQAERMRELISAADDRAAAAGGLVDGHVASALVLYREAALLYMAARLARDAAAPRAGGALRRDEAPPRVRPRLG